MKGKFQAIIYLFLVFFLFSALTIAPLALSKDNQSENMEPLENKGRWIDKPQSEWPQIAMINHIEYSDKSHPIAGCSFLLDTGNDILAVTAKHVLTYFKSEEMDSVSFKDTLQNWKMYPKNNSADMVIVDKLINENRDEPIEEVPPEKDWLLFSIKDRSENIQPLKFRTEPFQHGEKVYIVGWRYTDKDGTQRIYEGNYVRSLNGSLLISTEILADNTMPGLSGAPVIDSNGNLIGIMSHKHHKMEHLSSLDYPKQVLKSRSALGSEQESQSQQEKEINQLIRSLEHRGWENSVDALVEIGEPAVKSLIKALKGESKWIAARTCYALAKIQSREAVDALIEVLKNRESHHRVRDYACLALGDVTSEEVITLMKELVLHDSSTRVRMFAAQSLGKIGSVKATDALLGALKDESGWVRGRAAEALGQMNSKRAIEPLVQLLKDESRYARVHAREALMEIGESAAEPLAKALKDKNSNVRWQAALALGEIKSEKAIRGLIEAIKDEDWMVRNEAAVSLAKINSEKALEPLLKALNDKNCDVRKQAAWILGEMKSEKAMDSLIEALNDRDCGWMAAAALGKIQSEKAIEPLKDTMTTHNAQMRQAAAWALKKIVLTKDPEIKKSESVAASKSRNISYQGKNYPLSPEKIDVLPAIPSPFTTEEGMEVVVSHTKDEKYIIIPVTLQSGDPGKSKSYSGDQRKVDAEDFPALAKTGLHSEIELDMVKTITGRSIAEITSLGKPGGLSSDGFLAPDEDIISVIKADNRLVKKLGLTHPDMAKPLFHLFNLTEENLRISNFLSYESHHAVYPSYLYKGKKIFVEIEYTKGGQESIFNDGITGALAITIRRELDQKEKDFLDAKYAHLSEEQRNNLKDSLSRIFTGEMEAFYIMRYGFYEGHTDWRTDPLAIASVFGLKSIEEIEKAFPGKIYTTLTEHFTAH